MSAASALSTTAYEFALPWGPVLRGMRWGEAPVQVVFMHEPGVDLDAWGALPQAIVRDLPVQVVTVDLPGHGLSDDPWDEARLPEIVESLVTAEPAHSRTLVIAAGASALAALTVAPRLQLAGIVLLSVDTPGVRDDTPRSPATAKTFFAGSLAGDDLDVSRGLAATCGGWSSVTSIPVTERGTALLRTAWGDRISEHIIAFTRDCMYSRPMLPGATANANRVVLRNE